MLFSNMHLSVSKYLFLSKPFPILTHWVPVSMFLTSYHILLIQICSVFFKHAFLLLCPSDPHLSIPYCLTWLWFWYLFCLCSTEGSLYSSRCPANWTRQIASLPDASSINTRSTHSSIRSHLPNYCGNSSSDNLIFFCILKLWNLRNSYLGADFISSISWVVHWFHCFI